MNIVGRSSWFECLSAMALCLLLCGSSLSRAEDGIARDARSGCAVFKPNLKAGEVVAWKGACLNGHAKGQASILFG